MTDLVDDVIRLSSVPSDVLIEQFHVSPDATIPAPRDKLTIVPLATENVEEL